MAKIPHGAVVAVGKHPIPAGADVKADTVSSVDDLDAEPLDASDRAAGRGPQQPDSLDVLKPSTVTGAAARGMVQGTTLGFGDEAMGAADTASEASARARQAIGIEQAPMRDPVPAVNPTSPHISKSWKGNNDQSTADFLKEQDRIIPEQPAEETPQASLRNVYRRARNSYAAENEASRTAHPVVYEGSKLLGNVAAPIPGGAAKTSTGIAGRIAQSATQGLKFGLLNGAGESDADLASLDPNQAKSFLGDVGVGGALGELGGAAGGVISEGASKLAARFGRNAAEAAAARLASKLEKATASAEGAANQKKQAAYRIYEDLMNRIKDPNADPMKVRDAEDWLASPEVRELADSVFGNKVKDAPQAIEAWKAKLADLAAVPDKVAKEQAEYLGKNSLTNDVLPRVLHYGKPAAAAAIGGLLGGPAGAGGGAVVGAALGKPGRAAANLVKTPRFQIQLNELLSSSSEGLGAIIDDVAPALAAGETHETRDFLQPSDEDPKSKPETLRETLQRLRDEPVKSGAPIKKSWGKLGDRFNR